MAKLDTYLRGSFTQEQVGRLSNVDNILHQGAVGDGGTDNATAISAALSASSDRSVYVPKGTFLRSGSDFGASLGSGRFYGEGNIKTGANTRARYFSAISSAPSTGSGGSVDTAFNGDWSKSSFPIEHRITGTDTLGQPSSGYLYTEEAYPFFLYTYNSSGWNQSTSGNGGRTAACAMKLKMDQYGQGDGVCYNGAFFVSGAKAGATHFLANPAGVLLNGNGEAGADGVYLNVTEFGMADNGYDVAAIGMVINGNRTNSTGALSCVWMGHRLQSTGAQPWDVFYSANGLARVGLDLANMSFPGSGTYSIKPAITLSAGQRIAYNASTYASAPGIPGTMGGAYTSYQSTDSALVDEVGGFSVLRRSADSSSVNWLGMRARSTGGASRLFADGETNVSIEYVAKGTGGHLFRTNGAAATGASSTIQFNIYDTASAVNYLQATGAATGNSPYLISGGSDTNISINLQGKGSGGVLMRDGGGAVKVQVNTTGVGFFATSPVAKPTVSGSRGSNAALASLLTALASYGLVTDSTSA